MNPMYDLALDSYGPPLEPPDGYYFLTDAQMTDLAEREAEEEQEDEQYGECIDRPGGAPSNSGHKLEQGRG